MKRTKHYNLKLSLNGFRLFCCIFALNFINMKKILIGLILAFAFLSSYTQILKPEKWQFSHNQEGDEITLLFTVTLEKGWHIYSHYINEGGPIPTSLFIDENLKDKIIIDDKFEEIGHPIENFDKTFNMNVKYFEKKVTFKQKLKVKSSEDFTLKGYIEYMLCNDENCLPPTEFDFEVIVKGNKPIINSSNLKETTKNEKDPKETEFKTDEEKDSLILSKTDAIKDDTAHLNKTKEQKIEEVKHKTSTSKKNNENEKRGLFGFFLISFLAGLAAILTPCVFPMIPMTVSFFMHENKEKRKARIQATFYGLSIILIYTVIGTLVAIIFGAEFANWLSTHWLPNILFFLVFFIFALSFFGLFEITLPNWMIEKTDKQADKGGLLGAFFMAFTLVLVSFSCTGPIVGAILVESATTNASIKPIIGMFGFSLAFAIPFTLFAYFPEWLKKLPKSGGWLNTVKVTLGFLELALGLKFLSIADQTYHWHILDREVYLALWIVIFTMLGFYFLGKLRLKGDSPVEHLSVGRLLLALVTFSFVVYMIPGMFGAPLKVLSGYLPPQTTLDFDINRIVRNNLEVYSTSTNDQTKEICEKPKYSDFLKLPHGLKGYFDYEQAIACAKKLKKPIFIDFTGHGCVNCREMEANVWSDAKILSRLKNNFVVVALYVDDKTELPKEEWITSKVDGKIKKTLGKKYADFQISRYNVNAQPYYVLLDPYTEDTLTSPYSYNLDIDEFAKFLDKALSKFNEKYK